MRSFFKILFLFLPLFFFVACSNKKAKNASTIVWNKQVDSLLLDSNSVSLVADSIKKEILQSPSDSFSIHLLNVLAFYDQSNRGIFSEEAILQSKKYNYNYDLAFALDMRGWYFMDENKYDSATCFFSQSLVIAQKISSSKIIAQNTFLQGTLMYYQNKYEESETYLQKSISLSKVINYNEQLALSYYFLGKLSQFNENYDKAKEAYALAQKFAIIAGDKMYVVSALRAEARIYGMLLEYKTFQEKAERAIFLANQIKYKDEIATCRNMLGAMYYMKTDYSKAIENYNVSIEMTTALGNKSMLASSLSTMGSIYYSLDENTKALDYFNRALAIATQIKNNFRMSYCLNGIGQIQEDKLDYAAALKSYQESVELSKSSNSKYQSAVALHLIAQIYYVEKEYKKAIDYANQALDLSKQEEDKISTCYCYTLLSKIYFATHQTDKAKEMLKDNLLLAKDVSSLEDVNEIGAVISENEGDYKQALKYYKLFTQYKDTINNIQQVKKIAATENNEKETQLKLEQEKKNAVFKAEDEKKVVELKKQKTIQYLLFAVILLILIFAISTYRSLKQNKRKTAIIASQKAEMEKQKIIVEEKNKEITDSINYAKRLQEAILPPLKFIRKHLPNSFVVYKPKDIVAGDFYWMEETQDKIFIAAADCTGHGVPGAMVSVVCSNALNRAVKEFNITTTGQILDKVRELVIETFQKSESEVKDGMDISICAIKKNTGIIEWSGANNSLWYIQNNQLGKLKADKQPIGMHYNPLPFTTHQLILSKGDILYLFTDGYVDQFGGLEGKKFKNKQLQETLFSLKDISMERQKSEIDNVFTKWKNNLEQVDDVLLIGIKI